MTKAASCASNLDNTRGAGKRQGSCSLPFATEIFVSGYHLFTQNFF